MYVQGKRVRKNIPTLPEANGPEGQTGDHPDKVKKALFIGESTIAGLGVDTHQKGIAGQFALEFSKLQDCTISWKVYAKSGYTAKLVTRKLLPQIKENNVDLILVGLGGNDTFTMNSKWARDIKLFLKTIREKFPYCPLVFIHLPPVGEFPALPGVLRYCLDNHMNILRQQLIDIVKEKSNCYFISDKIILQDWSGKYGLENKPELYFSDGVHPSQLTYQVWAKSVAEYIDTQNIL